MNRRAAIPFFALVPFAVAPVLAAGADWISPGPAVPDVTLIDQDNQPQKLSELMRNAPVVVSFFFTGCRTVCPTQLVQLMALHAELGGAEAKKPSATLIMVSLDPFGDTPDAMRSYAERFGADIGPQANWFLLTGSIEDLSKVWSAFEQPAGNPDLHVSQFWIGQPERKRWTRVSSTAPTDSVVALLMEGAA